MIALQQNKKIVGDVFLRPKSEHCLSYCQLTYALPKNTTFTAKKNHKFSFNKISKILYIVDSILFDTVKTFEISAFEKSTIDGLRLVHVIKFRRKYSDKYKDALPGPQY